MTRAHISQRFAQRALSPAAWLVCFTLPAAAGNIDACHNNKAAPNAVVAACTHVIKSGGARQRIAALCQRGIAYHEIGKLDLALRDYNHCLRSQPRNAGVYMNRALIWNDKDNYKRALADINTSIRLNANDATAYLNRGNIYLSHGKLDETLADENKAIRLDPNLAKAYINRGLVWGRRKEWKRALTEFATAAQKQPKNAYAHLGLGEAFLSLKKYDDARREYKTTLQLDPGMTDARDGLARVQAAEFADGLKDAEKQLQQQIDDLDKQSKALDKKIKEREGGDKAKQPQ